MCCGARALVRSSVEGESSPTRLARSSVEGDASSTRLASSTAHPEPLDELSREVLALKIRNADCLPQCHGAFPESSPAIRGNNDLRHISLLLVVSHPSVPRSFWDLHLQKA